jgi:hypothetical protein
MNRNTSPEEAVEWILREENLIPRCRAVAMSVQAEAAFHKNRTTIQSGRKFERRIIFRSSFVVF